MRASLLSAEKRLVAVLPNAIRGVWYADAGPRTIHFWAPTFKWGLVIAAFSDLLRPPEKLSEKQSGALMATGVIWSRYSLVIKPKNWNLFSVNMFVAISNGIQLFRIYKYRSSLRNVEDAKPK